MRVIVAIIVTVLLAGSSLPAAAQTDLFSRDTVSGVADLRLAVSDSERSWLNGGFGKTRFGGGGGHALAQGEAVWNPQFGWGFSGVVDALAQPGQHKGLDAGQAYLQFKPLPIAGVHYRLRAGLMYPEISLEHGGYGGDPWIPVDTITPSAINSWVGEEIHPLAIEASARRNVGDHEIGVTLAAFRQSDTAGSELAFRGWSLSDYQGSAAARLPLPPLNRFIVHVQPDVTRPVLELDGRTGGYARVDWRLPSALTLNVFYFDNRGDKVSLDKGLQWAWETRFWDVGARYDLDSKTWLTSQAMAGKAEMGFHRARSVWVDIDFASAYLMASHKVGRNTLSARMEAFRVDDNNITPASDYDEHGWALTAAWKHPLADHLILLVEALHVKSMRPEQALAGEAPRQDDTTLQAALRISF